MLSWFKRNWLEILVFAGIATVYLICLAPDRTWMNTDTDGSHYVYSAKWFFPSHKTSAPLFLLLGHLFLYIPIGTDFWRMALMSGVSSVVASVYVYGIVKHYTANRIGALIGAVVFGGSAIAISQGTIVETYGLITALSLAGYYYVLKKRYNIAAIMFGAGCAVHLLIGFTILIVLMRFKEMRRWIPLLIMASFAIFYLYIPLTNRPPYIWTASSGSGLIYFFKDMWGTIAMLTGGLSIWDFPKRIIDAILITASCLGLGTITAIYAAKKLKWMKEPLLWMAILPILYYMTDLSPQTYVYVITGVAFGACLAGIGVSYLNKKWATAIVGLSAIGLMAFNCNYFDIGRTLDKNMSAKNYYEQLSIVPDNNILIATQGWEWTVIFVYNQYEHRNIIPVASGNLSSAIYRQSLLETYGIKSTGYPTPGSLLIEEKLVINSVIAENDNVWITETRDASTYGCEIVKATHPVVVDYTPLIPTWKIKPNNPYDIITGAVEIRDWEPIMMSNYNVALFFLLGCIGAMAITIPIRLWRKKNVTQ
jgi:hypothetical protein